MNIYRVENADGDGPFESADLHRAAKIGGVDLDEVDPRSHPGPCEYNSGMAEAWNAMRKSNRHHAYVFGCASLEHVLRWFSDPRLRKGLDIAGQQVSVYWVPTVAEVVHGSIQVAFKRGRKKPRNRIPLSSLSAKELVSTDTA